MARGKLALLLQHLERECRGRQRQRQPDEQGLPCGEPERRADRGQNQGGDDELRRAEAEDRRAQRPQAHRAELEPDHEQEHHDAELAELEDLLDIVEGVEGPERIGANDDAGGEIAKHCADAEEATERRGNSGGGQKHRHLNQLRRCHGRLIPPRPFGSMPQARRTSREPARLWPKRTWPGRARPCEQSKIGNAPPSRGAPTGSRTGRESTCHAGPCAPW